MKFKKICTSALGPSAAFYLATYTTQKGSISTLPLTIAAILTLILLITISLKNDSCNIRKLSKNEVLWILLLFSYGVWSVFTVWLDKAPINNYEVPAKFILGSIIAIPILKIGIDLKWIKIGTAIGSLLIAILIFREYDGYSRFSPIMNATKWGNAVAFQTMLTFGLVILEKKHWQKALFTISSLVGLYALAIIGTRGAFLPVIALIITMGIIFTSRLKIPVIIISFITIFFGVLTITQLPIVKSRMNDTISDFNEITKDNYQTSIGVRLILWKGGLQAFAKSPIIGHGYDFKKIFEDYKPSSSGEAVTANWIIEGARLFHNSFIDTLVTKGAIGFILVISMLMVGIRNYNLSNFILMMPPTVGFAAASLTDSTLALGITSTYFILAGTILKAVRIKS